MVAIVSDKQDRTLSRKLASFLENQGYKVFELWRDRGNDAPDTAVKNLVAKANLAIFITNKTSLNSKFIFNSYKSFFKAEKPIILFINSEIEESLINWYFLETHDYIKAYDTTFEKAAQSLTVLLDELSKDTGEPQKNSPVSDKQTKSKSHNTKLLAVLAAIIIVGGYFLIKNNNNTVNTRGSQQQTPIITTLPAISPNKPSNTFSQNPDEDLIGTWKLVDYQDNIPRAGKALAEFNQIVNNLKKSFLLVFNADHTFIRKGFTPKTETGYWKIDKQTHTLYMTQTKDGQGDGLKILTLNKNQLIFEVASYEKQYGTVIVRFTLQKAQ